MTTLEIEKKLKSIISEKLEVPEYRVTNHATFRQDLGADSLDTYELVYGIEEELGVIIPDESLNDVETVDDAFEVIYRVAQMDFIKEIDTRIICFRLRPDGKIEVTLKIEDGSWCFADGRNILPSNICLLTFTRWANILKELEEIINDPNTKEMDLQKYFETYPQLLAGDDYDIIIPQAVIVNEDNSIWKSDFVLAPKNQYEFSKVLEIKIPQLNLINRPKSNHVTFSAKIWNAIQQIRDYGHAFDSKATREKFKKEYKIDVFKPDLHLIAGRKWDIKLIDSMRKLQKEIPVKIEDWDTVLARLKRTYL